MISNKVFCDSATMWQFGFQDPGTPIIIVLFGCCLFFLTIFLYLDLDHEKSALTGAKLKTPLGDLEDFGTHQYIEKRMGRSRHHTIVVKTQMKSRKDFNATLSQMLKAYTSHSVYKGKVPHQLSVFVKYTGCTFNIKNLGECVSFGVHSMNALSSNEKNVKHIFTSSLQAFERRMDRLHIRSYHVDKVYLVIEFIIIDGVAVIPVK